MKEIDRRTMLTAGGVAIAGLVSAPWLRGWFAPTASVFVARNQRYDGPLRQTIRDGLRACGFDAKAIRGKLVLLKPNMVEPLRGRPQMTTHPAMVVAVAEVFRDWDAEVTIGEAPGHLRDTDFALMESGIDGAVMETGARFADLNYEEVGWAPNRGRRSSLKGFYFPKSVLEADLVVSLPKLKTHHWVGVTASMKNMYGVLPGVVYGWPKNVLHHHGIPETVVDINASLPPTIAVVDGIDCMEGDGPILGSRKHMGLVVVGMSLPAVDATVCRIMGVVPERVSYLMLAADRLGPIAVGRIEQRGERWQEVASPFQLLDAPHLQSLRAVGPLVT